MGPTLYFSGFLSALSSAFFSQRILTCEGISNNYLSVSVWTRLTTVCHCCLSSKNCLSVCLSRDKFFISLSKYEIHAFIIRTSNFLDASSHLYERVCRSVPPSVGQAFEKTREIDIFKQLSAKGGLLGLLHFIFFIRTILKGQ